MDFVGLEVRDHVGIVTVDRPPVNAVNLQLYGEITATFGTINDRDDVRVAVLRAEGGKGLHGGQRPERVRHDGPRQRRGADA